MLGLDSISNFGIRVEWKGIEANLAKNSNAKFVVIGNSKNGLPLILGQ